MRILILSLICLCFLNCSSNNKSINDLPIINIVQGLNNLDLPPLSRYASKIEYIPLERDMNIPISHISKTTFYKLRDYYYYGSISNKKVLVFNKDGKYVYSIGAVGRAANEFSSILDMKVSEKRNELAVSDISKLQCYNLKGEHLKTINLNSLGGAENIIIRGFDYIGDFICLKIIDHITDVPGIIFINSKGEKVLADILSEQKERNTEFQSSDGQRWKQKTSLNTYVYNDSLVVVNPLTDTLFAYTKNLQKVSRYRVELGKYKLNPDRSNNDRTIRINPNMVYETDNLLFFSIFTNNNDFSFFQPRLANMCYDKVMNKTYAVRYNEEDELSGFYNDLDNGAPFEPHGFYGNQMYQIINAYKFIEYSEKYKSSQMKTIAAQLTENSNPVLVLVTFD